MTKSIEILKKPRLHLLNFIKDLSIEQLNKIPTGFNNNIIWNLGHIVAAQQGICYRRAGVTPLVNEDYFKTYGGETRPERFIDAAELEVIKELFTSTIDQLAIDLKNNLFANYTPWTTRYGVDINNIDEAIKFLPFHEGLHSGYIWAMKRTI
jgi:hypothetical protein